MEINKLRSILAYNSCPETDITLISTQMNLLIMNLNSLFQNYEHRLMQTLEEKQKIKEELCGLT